MKRNIRALIIAFTLTSLYGLYYFGVPAVLNCSKSTEFLEKIIQKESGFKVKLDKPKVRMGILPSIRLCADNFRIINDDGSKAFSIDNPDTKIKLLPFIFGRAEIDYFSTNKIDTYLVFDKNSQLKLGQYPLIMPSKSKISISRASVKIGDYNVYLKDELQNKNIVLDGKTFHLDDYDEGKRINFGTTAKLYVGEKASDIDLNLSLKLPISHVTQDQLQLKGKISNLNLADFSVYAKSLSKNKVKSLSGLINFASDTVNDIEGHKKITSRVNVNNLGIMFDDNARSIYHKGKIDVRTNLTTIKDGIEIEDLKVKADGIDVLARGNIKKLDNKFPDIDMNVTINKSRTESFIPLLPGEENLMEEVNLYKLKKYGFLGDITGNLEIKGKADEPDITGSILVANGVLKPLPGNPPGAIIKLIFNGKTLTIDSEVPASHTQTVFVKGVNDLYGKKLADLYITSTKNIPLKSAQIVLNPLHEILNFDLGPVPIMDIRGIGNINLHVTGNRKDPHGWGAFNFIDTQASFLDIHNMTLEHGYGSLEFDDQNTHFYTNGAKFNGKEVKVDGTCTLLGALNFDVTAGNQDLGNLLKIVQTSPMLEDIQKMLAPIKSAEGPSDFKIKLTGQVTDVNDVVFNKNIFAKGSINLHSDNVTLKDLPVPVKNLTGVLNFNNLDADFKISSQVEQSKYNLEGSIKDDKCDVKVISDKFVLAEGLKYLPKNVIIPFKNDIGKITTSFVGYYNGSIEKINFNNIRAKGKIYSNKGAKSSIIVDNGNFELNNSRFVLYPLKGSFSGNPYSLSADISDMFDNNRKVNGNFNIKNLNLALVKGLKFEDFLPAETAKQLGEIKEMNGTIDLKASVRNNNSVVLTNLKDTAIVYGAKNLKVKVLSGLTQLRNDVLYLNKVNAYVGEMPLFIDGRINNIYNNPNANIYVSTKPTQMFFDEFFNKKAVYPIKVKGDIICTSRINGTQNNLNARSELKLDEGSSIYYMGSSIGDPVNPVKIYADTTVSPNRLRINSFKYDKIISSQNNKMFATNMLNASGTIDMLSGNNVAFRNFRIKTEHPTDAKIFNMIFRKPFMKQGLFTSDLTINGNSLNPNVLGKLEVTSIDMPLFDATIKDVGFDFKRDNIYIKSRGVVLTNDLTFNAVMRNKFTPPYVIEDIKLKMGDLNINKITDMIRDNEAEALQNPTTASSAASQPLDFTRVTIKKASIDADTIQIKNINAQDFAASMSLDDKMVLNANNFHFKIAEGSVNGRFKYNFLTHNVNLGAHMNDANAQVMAEALFDLKNQIYGSVTGDVELVCNGRTHDSCFKTLGGSGSFVVADGKMPKLGSLEYLLKAGNLIQTGLTGISINSLVDLITPLKTGEFESIGGNFHIADGIADVVNVYSDGRDLNLYLTGSYNLTNSIADMQIYGSLAKDISTVFGKIKNASLNTLLNTIPGLGPNEISPSMEAQMNKIPNTDLNSSANRIFVVDILGDINGTNYVKSFKWVK